MNFTVQARMAPYRASTSVAVNVAGAVYVAGDRVAYYMGANEPLLINGASAAVPPGGLNLPNGGRVVRSTTGYTVTLPSGESVLLEPWGTLLNITVSVPDRRKHYTGLLGTWDGNPNNDLVSRSGQAFTSSISEADLYGAFGDSWRVTQEESLFDYAEGEDTSTFTDDAFPTHALTAATLPTQQFNDARAACTAAGVVGTAELNDCVLDVAATSDGDATTIATVAQAAASTTLPPPLVVVKPTGYSQDFEGFSDGHWSSTQQTALPALDSVEATTVLGPFASADPVTLTLDNLPSHASITVAFDTQIIGAWGDDQFTLTGDSNGISVATTFSNTLATQSFPDQLGVTTHPAQSGALVTGSVDLGQGSTTRAIYHHSYSFSHTATGIQLSFVAPSLPEGAVWTIDNVSVITSNVGDPWNPKCTSNGSPLDDHNPCTIDGCDPSIGVVHTPRPAGTSCSDGNLCNGVEACNASGQCGATPLVVNDNNPCTADSCDPQLGVIHTPTAQGSSCSNGNKCDGDEMCDGLGACVAGTPPDPASFPPDTSCNGVDDDCDGVKDDDYAVTQTSCGQGACAATGELRCTNGHTTNTCTPLFAAPDDHLCDSIDDDCDNRVDEDYEPSCVAGGVTACVSGSVQVTSCDDASVCTADSCTAGACIHTAVSCDDGNACTADSCDPVLGCASAINTGATCSDGNVCTASDICSALGTCTGTPLNPDDGNPCTADACDPASGVTHTGLGGLACNDNNACTTGDACTMGGTCLPNAMLTCDDGLYCNGAETCNPSSGCVAGTPPALSDGVSCTQDSCDEATDTVVHTPNDAACNNGNACDGTESCQPATGCASGMPPATDDGNACTVDACAPATGVSHTPLVCVDGNQCTVDSCVPASGCVYPASPDGTACSLPNTTTARCTAGVCAIVACDANHGDCDGNPSNGCEADLTASSQTCGACNIRCGVNEHCELSACVSSGITIGLGAEHGCAVMPDGRVMCWGANSSGQIGDGTSTARSTPVYVTGLSDARSVDGGYGNNFGDSGSGQTCAVRATGGIVCWGQNGHGQLGDGTGVTSTTPVAVVGITDGLQVSTARLHTCALRANGHVMCWGDAETGYLGNGNPGTFDVLSPVEVSNLTDAVAIAAGDESTCALRSTGQLACWGWNRWGECGNGTTNQQNVPVFLSTPNDVIKIAAGFGRTCAIRANHTLMCWGKDIGSTPVTVAGLSGVVDVAVSHGWNRQHICAVLDTGGVRCWGSNDLGQLGNGTTTASSTPVVVSGVSTAVRVGAANGNSCAVLASDHVTCWGQNNRGDLGDGTTTSRLTPDMVLLQYPGCTGPSCSTPQTGSISVPGTANAWGAGLATAPGDGSVPPLFSLTYRAGAVVTFPSVTGTIVESSAGAQPPDGVAGAWTLPNGTAIAGYTHSTLARSLAGVFLGPITPGAPPPASITISDGNFPYLYPAIGQMFFIGDGKTASGTVQEFHVPLGATRLALGVTDLCSGGSIGCFGDNSGAYTANFSVAAKAAAVVQVDLSRTPAGLQAASNLVISNQWNQVGILFSARKSTEAVGVQGTISPIVSGTGFDCSRFYFFTPDTLGEVGIFRFVVPGTAIPIDATHFEMVAGWDPGESITLVGFNAAGAITAQQTFNSPGSASGLVQLDGTFRFVEVRTQGNPGIGFANCGLSGGYGLRFTPAQ